MTALATAPVSAGLDRRFRSREIWRIVRLHAVNPSIFFGVPWLILAGAWAVSMVLAVIITGSGAQPDDVGDGMRYSWAVLSPQWYLVVVGVQAVGLTFSFALGFGATRRDFWLGTSLMFALVSLLNAAAIATLVQIEIATDGWWIDSRMFDALWYGQTSWFGDFYATFALQLLVLFVGAGVTTVFMRWRMRGMMILTFGAIALALAAVALVSLSQAWPTVFEWLGSLGLGGAFTLVLALAAVFAVGGYLVIRRATPR